MFGIWERKELAAHISEFDPEKHAALFGYFGKREWCWPFGKRFVVKAILAPKVDRVEHSDMSLVCEVIGAIANLPNVEYIAIWKHKEGFLYRGPAAGLEDLRGRLRLTSFAESG